LRGDDWVDVKVMTSLGFLEVPDKRRLIFILFGVEGECEGDLMGDLVGDFIEALRGAGSSSSDDVRILFTLRRFVGRTEDVSVDGMSKSLTDEGAPLRSNKSTSFMLSFNNGNFATILMLHRTKANSMSYIWVSLMPV